MNRTDRLLAIVLELQRYGTRRAEDLAKTFEVSRRTIYRDIQALSEAGIPLVAMTGHGYSLVEDYFLPPVNFTTDEALVLLLGSDIMEQNTDAEYRKAVLSATKKIETIIPNHLIESVNYLRRNIKMLGMRRLNDQKSSQLTQIRRAMIDQKQIQINYTKRLSENEITTPTTRVIAPYSLAHLKDDWYIMAHCYLRDDVRVFRLSRIDKITILPRAFKRPLNFDPDWINSQRPRNVFVKVHLSHKVSRWVRESLPYFLVDEETTESGLLLTFHVQYDDELLQWILGWGSHMEVLEPLSLRQKVIHEIEQMLENHKTLLT